MAKKTVKTKTTGDLESRVSTLEARKTALEQLSKKFSRKKREYTEEQRASIRQRLLAGQEAARKLAHTAIFWTPTNFSSVSSTSCSDSRHTNVASFIRSIN